MVNIYQNDVGIKIVVEFNNKENDVTINDYDDVKLLVKKPNDKKAVWECDIDKGNNEISYTIIEGDLDEVGLYKIQPKVKIGDYYGRTTPFSINVLE